MGRLIDLRADGLGARLELERGDVVLLPATGARIARGTAVEISGAHQNATPLADGRVIAPAGVPDVVVLTALHAGSARVTIVSGTAFEGDGAAELDIIVT